MNGQTRAVTRISTDDVPSTKTEETLPMPAAGVSYQRTREMTIDELLLENRIVFLIGDINHASAARVMIPHTTHFAGVIPV